MRAQDEAQRGGGRTRARLELGSGARSGMYPTSGARLAVTAGEGRVQSEPRCGSWASSASWDGGEGNGPAGEEKEEEAGDGGTGRRPRKRR